MIGAAAGTGALRAPAPTCSAPVATPMAAQVSRTLVESRVRGATCPEYSAECLRFSRPSHLLRFRWELRLSELRPNDVAQRLPARQIWRATMGRTSLRAAAVVTLAALFTGTASASFGAVPEEVNTPVLTDAADGHYIVLLKDAPLATYEGGTNGLQRTKPDKGKQLDADAPSSKAYLAHLKKQQDQVAADTGVVADANYGVVTNGFSAELTAAQANKLAGDKSVLGVFPDEIYHPTATPSTEFLGLGSVNTGTGGVWDAVGGVAEAGKGIVVGVVDTGIAPEHPSFAGDALKKKGAA